MSINRYALPPYEDDPYCWSLVESEEGGWVRYDDHAAEVERLREALRGLLDSLSLRERRDNAEAVAAARAALEEA